MVKPVSANTISSDGGNAPAAPQGSVAPAVTGVSGGSSVSLPVSSAQAPPPAEKTLFTATAIPGTSSTTVPADMPPAYSMGTYFQGIGVLLLMLFAVWAVVALMKKSGKFRFMPSSGTFPRDGLRMETQLPLGPHKGLVVVRFFDKRLLLGITDQQITLVAEREYHDDEGESAGTKPQNKRVHPL